MIEETLPELKALREIARRHGTPLYAYDLSRVRAQVERLRTTLPEAVGLFYSLKANPSLGLCSFVASCGLGADVASAGELVTAVEAGFPPSQLFVSGPYKSPETLDCLRTLPEALLSIDSVDELQTLAGKNLPQRALLRLRPDFESSAVVSTGPGARFGIPFGDLPRCREAIAGHGAIVGFHVFCGSQVLAAGGIARHLRGAAELSFRAADSLGIAPEVLNLGGGFGIPYGPVDGELDLREVGRELESLVRRAHPARIILELGRYVVASAGWYLTTVVGAQTHAGRKAVVVDGGTHQRADLCGLALRTSAYPPVLLEGRAGTKMPTDVLGCLSAPGDVLAEAAQLPPLEAGDVLAFPNAGAYGLVASPFNFHCSPAPAEAVFDGDRITLIRAPRPAASLLNDQVRLAVDNRT